MEPVVLHLRLSRPHRAYQPQAASLYQHSSFCSASSSTSIILAQKQLLPTL